MMPAGVWWRPGYYGTKADRTSAIETEVKAVRQNVGLIDVSTLGGLDVRGPDAAEFLNRMYTFSYTKQPIGRSRYVLMTDNAGVITDDGVACRFHDEHFYVTATTSGVDAVYRQMLFWNAQWRLDVDVANVTAALNGVNIAGPKSRQVLQKVCTDIDLSPEGFPYMGVKMGTVAGIPARVIVVEPTGAETELLLEAGPESAAQKLTLVMHGRTNARPGETVHLRIDPAKAHVFDGQSGQRLA